MRTIRLVVEYDGTGYCGWQRQSGAASAGAPSVQATLEAAVREIAGEPAAVTGAGRTDAGVHACGQVACFATTSRIPADRFPAALNAHLPADIRVLGADEVPERFHPRFDALARAYRYEILNRPAPSALLRHRAYHVPEPLDVEAMQRALAAFLGRHDFAAYHGVGSNPKTTTCTVLDAAWQRSGDRVTLTITADRFLRHMVRILVGTLVRVGTGRLPVAAPGEFLADPPRRPARRGRAGAVRSLRDRAGTGCRPPVPGLWRRDVHRVVPPALSALRLLRRLRGLAAPPADRPRKGEDRQGETLRLVEVAQVGCARQDLAPPGPAGGEERTLVPAEQRVPSSVQEQHGAGVALEPGRDVPAHQFVDDVRDRGEVEP